MDNKRFAIEKSLVEVQAIQDKVFVNTASLESGHRHLAESIATDADIKLGQGLSEKEALREELAS